MGVLIGCITLDIFNVVNLRATLEIGAHSNHVEFHVNVYTFRSNVVVHQEVGNYVLFVPITPHTIHIGHASHHHDRCCVGAIACLIQWRENLLVHRQIVECINDVFVQHHRVRS